MKNKKKIVFYYPMIIIGGVEMAMLYLFKKISNDYDITVMISDDMNMKNDYKMLLEFSKYSTVVVGDVNNPIKCDVCVWCGLYFDWNTAKHYISADKYKSWIHSIPYIYRNCLLKNKEFISSIDEYICVSKCVSNNLFKTNGIYGTIIYNEINPDIITLANEYEVEQRPLTICSVCRISREKQLELMKPKLDELDMLGVDYIYYIVGSEYDGNYMQQLKLLFNNNKVIFVGHKYNPYPYMKVSHYLAMPSKFESWGLAITEAKILGTSIIVNNFESASEQVDERYGYFINDIKGSDLIPVHNKFLFNYRTNYERWFKIL